MEHVHQRAYAMFDLLPIDGRSPAIVQEMVGRASPPPSGEYVIDCAPPALAGKLHRSITDDDLGAVVSHPVQDVALLPAQTLRVDVRPIADQEFAEFEKMRQERAAERGRQDAAPAAEAPPPPAAANQPAPVQPEVINLVVAKHVMLLEGKKIVTREEVEKMMAALPNPENVVLHTWMSSGLVYGIVDDSADRGAIMSDAMAWSRQLAARLGCQWNFRQMQSGGWMYDSIKTPAALVLDESLRNLGRVQRADGKPLAGAEVVHTEPSVNGGRSQDFLMYLRGPRLAYRLEWQVTDTDADGSFAVYVPSDKSYQLIVLHEEGFALTTSEAFRQQSTITVKPWARIHGRIDQDDRFSRWIDGQSYSRGYRENKHRIQEINIQTSDTAAEFSSPLQFHLRGRDIDQPNPNGEFAFNYVPPFETAVLGRSVFLPSGGNTWLTTGGRGPGDQRTIRIVSGEKVTEDLPPFTDEEFATIEAAEERAAARRGRGRRGGNSQSPGARRSDGQAPSSP
jgi:hypothetical protein